VAGRARAQGAQTTRPTTATCVSGPAQPQQPAGPPLAQPHPAPHGDRPPACGDGPQVAATDPQVAATDPHVAATDPRLQRLPQGCGYRGRPRRSHARHRDRPPPPWRPTPPPVSTRPTPSPVTVPARAPRRDDTGSRDRRQGTDGDYSWGDFPIDCAVWCRAAVPARRPRSPNFRDLGELWLACGRNSPRSQYRAATARHNSRGNGQNNRPFKTIAHDAATLVRIVRSQPRTDGTRHRFIPIATFAPARPATATRGRRSNGTGQQSPRPRRVRPDLAMSTPNARPTPQLNRSAEPPPHAAGAATEPGSEATAIRDRRGNGNRVAEPPPSPGSPRCSPCRLAMRGRRGNGIRAAVVACRVGRSIRSGNTTHRARGRADAHGRAGARCWAGARCAAAHSR
jgi:hypothetical protein